MEPGHPFSLLALAPGTGFEPGAFTSCCLGSLYFSLHMLINVGLINRKYEPHIVQ